MPTHNTTLNMPQIVALRLVGQTDLTGPEAQLAVIEPPANLPTNTGPGPTHRRASPNSVLHQFQHDATSTLARRKMVSGTPSAEQLVTIYSESPCNRDLRTDILKMLAPHLADVVKTLPNQTMQRQKAILEAVRGTHANFASGRIVMSSDQRAELGKALADAFMARTQWGESIADLRSRFVGADPIVQRPVTPAAFTTDTLDLSGVAASENEATALTHTRDAHMVTIDGKTYRVKNIKYGNVRAAEEVLMSKFYALSGLDCPNAKIATHGEHLFRYAEHTRRDFDHHAQHPERFALVASELVPGFKDLGNLVLDQETTRPLILSTLGQAGAEKYDQALSDFHKAQQAEQRCDPREDMQVAEKSMARADQLKARRKMVALLPERYKQDTITAYCVSRLVANWDFENFDLFNFGFHGQRSLLVDFGNCGTMGFGGKQKPDSLEGANTKARNIDPQAPNPIRPEDIRFDRHMPPTLTGIGSLPRARPVAPLVQSITQAENRMAQFGGKLRELGRHDVGPLSPVLEATYRMALIPDDAFVSVAKAHWPSGSQPFAYYPEDKLRLSADEFAELMIQRRNALTGQFKASDLQVWADKYPRRAQAAHQQVSAAVAALTGLHVA